MITALLSSLIVIAAIKKLLNPNVLTLKYGHCGGYEGLDGCGFNIRLTMAVSLEPTNLDKYPKV
jgi:hypothetical protein